MIQKESARNSKANATRPVSTKTEGNTKQVSSKDKLIIPLLVLLSSSGYCVGLLMGLDWAWNCYSYTGMEQTCTSPVLQFISSYGEKFHGYLAGTVNHMFAVSAIALAVFLTSFFFLVLVKTGNRITSLIYTVRILFGLLVILEVGIFSFDHYFWEMRVTLSQVGTSLQWFSNADLFATSLTGLGLSFIITRITQGMEKLTNYQIIRQLLKKWI